MKCKLAVLAYARSVSQRTFDTWRVFADLMRERKEFLSGLQHHMARFRTSQLLSTWRIYLEDMKVLKTELQALSEKVCLGSLFGD